MGVIDRYLDKNIPVIITLEGILFHNLFTKDSTNVFNNHLNTGMNQVTYSLCKWIPECRLAYQYSHEIHILLTSSNTDTWLNYDVDRIISMVAGYASSRINTYLHYVMGVPVDKTAVFNCKIFNIPSKDVNNYFAWKQENCIQKSINTLFSFYYPNKEQPDNDIDKRLIMIKEKGDCWNNLDSWFKYGDTFIKKSDEVTQDSFYLFKDLPFVI